MDLIMAVQLEKKLIYDVEDTYRASSSYGRYWLTLEKNIKYKSSIGWYFILNIKMKTTVNYFLEQHHSYPRRFHGIL